MPPLLRTLTVVTYFLLASLQDSLLNEIRDQKKLFEQQLHITRSHGISGKEDTYNGPIDTWEGEEGEDYEEIYDRETLVKVNQKVAALEEEIKHLRQSNEDLLNESMQVDEKVFVHGHPFHLSIVYTSLHLTDFGS